MGHVLYVLLADLPDLWSVTLFLIFALDSSLWHSFHLLKGFLFCDKLGASVTLAQHVPQCLEGNPKKKKKHLPGG